MQDGIKDPSPEQALAVPTPLGDTGGAIRALVLSESGHLAGEVALDCASQGHRPPSTGASSLAMAADGASDVSDKCPAHAPYTDKQGQYLAFIYYYAKIHGCSPSQADLQGYFRVSPPAVHQMVLSLEKRGFIERTPGQGRSLKLLLSRAQLPDLL